MALAPEALRPLARLKLDRQPVAIGFLGSPPADLPRVARPQPAGCSYWKQAADGEAFYTTPADHENCPVGAFTHGVALPPAKAAELESLVGTMVELKYLRTEEVAGLPHRNAPMQVAAYAPLAAAAFDPDVVIFRGNAHQVMLLSDAARAAGAFSAATALGRPACSLIPQATSSGSGVASVGCIGNRVYTELGDDELYFAVPGEGLAGVLGQLDAILDANAALEKFHRERKAGNPAIG